jgi:hypothetical protein
LSTCQGCHDSFGAAGDHCQIGASGAVRPATALLPVLQRARIESETPGELGAAQAGGGTDGADVYIGYQWNMVDGSRAPSAFCDFGSLTQGFD